jgi:capsular exopolysaccharide synthesis family protein
VVNKLDLTQHSSFDNQYKKIGAVTQVKQLVIEYLPFMPPKELMVDSVEKKLELKLKFAVEQLMSTLQISPIKNTQIVEISVVNEDPKLAAVIANTVGEVYIENYLQSKLDMTKKATTWLNISIEGLRNELDEAERKLGDFYETEQLVNIDGVVGLISEELQRLTTQLQAAQAELQTSELIYQQVQRSSNIEDLSSLTEVINHPSIVSIKEAELAAQIKVSDLNKVYGHKHPKLIAANVEYDTVENNLNNKIRVLVSGINAAYQNSTNKVNIIEKNIELAKQRFRKLSSLDNRSRSLQREVDINQQLYSSFFTRLKEANELGGFESANARLLDEAEPPSYPSAPKTTFTVAVAFAFSLAVGILTALIVNGLNNGIRSVVDVERQLSHRMLGIIPWQPHKKRINLPVRHFFNPRNHIFSESVRTLRTSLQLLNVDKPGKTILVTSSVPKEGKSTVAINLAFALGQLNKILLNKVLLIDADLRRPSLAKSFELAGFQPGLANIVKGTHSAEECIVHDKISGIDILSAGSIPSNPLELLDSATFAELLQTFEQHYEHIVIDTAPIQAVSDAIVVSKVCDSIVYVVKADSTSNTIINSGLSRFLDIGRRVDGVVLNQVDLKKANETGLFEGFYDQYGYGTYDTEKKVT